MTTDNIRVLRPDLAAFEAVPKPGGPTCSIKRFRDRLDEQQQLDFDTALDAGHISGVQIKTVLEGWVGERVSYQQLRTHRRGECRCKK